MLFFLLHSRKVILRNQPTLKNYLLYNVNCKRFIQTDKTKRGSDEHKAITPEPIGGIGEIWLRPNLKNLPPPPKMPQDFMDFSNRHWISYGFDELNMKNDRLYAHITCFALVLFLTLVVIVSIYRPDMELRQWVHREAYLELARREKYGLPLIDKNYVDPATIDLPSEEELEGINIYI